MTGKDIGEQACGPMMDIQIWLVTVPCTELSMWYDSRLSSNTQSEPELTVKQPMELPVRCALFASS